MSSFISLYFFIFLPVVVLFNFVIPRKFRYIWLFVTSICFYGSIDLGSTIVLALVILLTYGAALLMEKSDEGKRKLVLTGSLIVTIGTLVVFKYLGFIVGTFKGLTGGEKRNIPKVICKRSIRVDLKEFPNLDMENSEHIVDYEYQYQYCLNISFNEDGTAGRGSAIFLHCFGPTKPYTGGCVALPENIMEMVMQNVTEDCVVVIDTLDNMGGSL